MDRATPPDDDPTLRASERRWKLFGQSHLPYRILLLAKMIDGSHRSTCAKGRRCRWPNGA
jgi:hypothetical protein